MFKDMLNNRKGMVFVRARDTISFFIGLILAAFGLIPLLSSFGVLPFSLPEFLLNLPVSVLVWIVAIAGLYIVIDGFIEPPMHMLHWALILGGIILLIVGLIPILHSFNVIPFTIPFLGENLVVYQVMIGIEGIFLMIAGVSMR
ncbi:MAG: hypothetical protein R6U32_02740 [Candidatus Woesearchaeota archaeon]